MSIKEHPLIKELSKYNLKDIYFLKSKWRVWIAERTFQHFEKIDQKPNVQTVYAILDPTKIISVENARDGFYAVRTKHSKEYDVVIIAKIQNERIEVMTYYKESIRQRWLPQN
jgi:hypothetical protein